MSTVISVVQSSNVMRLVEIGELTALAYLADGLVDANDAYLPSLRDAQTRAEAARLLVMTDGDNGRALGTITLVHPQSAMAEVAADGEWELRMLAVSPLERGRGVGRSLTQAALDLAVNEGAQRVVLSTQPAMHAAHRLYDQLGFIRTPERDWSVPQQKPEDPVIDLLAYVWNVTA